MTSTPKARSTTGWDTTSPYVSACCDRPPPLCIADYLFQAEDYYYPPQPVDAYMDHLNAPIPPPLSYLNDQPVASSSRLSLAPTDYDLASIGGSIASPLSTLSNGTVKRKRGRPRKVPQPNGVNGANGANGANGSAPPKSHKAKPKSGTKSGTGTPAPAANGDTPHHVTPETVCSLCGGTEGKNREGVREKMVSCVRCGRSGHPTCLGITNPDVVKKMRSYDWCCIECKPCEVCLDKGEDVSCKPAVRAADNVA